MGTTLERSLAAAVRYIQDHIEEGTKLYFDDMPENFFVPSVYFPVPWSTSRKATLSSYSTKIMFECWFFGSTDWDAYTVASVVRDSILLDNCCIPARNQDGNCEGHAVRVRELEVRRIEKRTIKLSMELKDYFYGSSGHDKAESIHFGSLTQKEDIYGAWHQATAEQREEEEVQKECLKKALEDLQLKN